MSSTIYLSELISPFLDTLQERSGQVSTRCEPRSGLSDLDRVIPQFSPDELIIIGARPAMGKTSLLVGIAIHTAVEQGLSVMLFTESSRMAMVSRLLASLGNIDLCRLASGRLNDEEWPRLTEAVERLRGAKIYIQDFSDSSSANFAEVVNKVKCDFGPSLVLVDSLKLPDAKNTTPEQDVTRTLKELAREHQIPIIATTHLSSALEHRTCMRPRLSDLISAESVERDADVVMLLSRQQYYEGGSAESLGSAEVFVARNRNGATASVKVAFRQGVARFENFSQEHSRSGHDLRFGAPASDTPRHES